MLRFLNKKLGQNTAEYAILIGVIVAAAIAMQVYVRRGMQARIRDAVDYSMENPNTEGNVFSTPQYEPYYMTSELETVSSSDSEERMVRGGSITREIMNEFTSRAGNITYSTWNITQ